MIPKIIHQTWATSAIPEPYLGWSATWIDNHPGYDYQLHTDADNLRLVEQHYPQWLPTYLSYPHNIQRVDLARLMWLHKYGGIYADMDMQCLQNTEALFITDMLVLEPSSNYLGATWLPANWVMAFEPGAMFLTNALDRALDPFIYTGVKRKDVCWSTGAGLLLRTWRTLKNYNLPMPAVSSSFLFSPYTHQQMQRAQRGNQVIDTDIEGAYGIHHFKGSWW